MNKTEEMLSNYMRKKKAQINDYENALKAFLSLKKYFEERFSARVYFGGTLKSKTTPAKTPDIIIEFPLTLDIGEVKRSLKDKKETEDWAQYTEYIQKECMKQITEYKKITEENGTRGTFYLLLPHKLTKAVNTLRNKILQPKENTVLLTYAIELTPNTEITTIQKEIGTVIESEVETELNTSGIQMRRGELANLIAKYKIYEENHHTPFEYMLIILWEQIFPEALKLGTEEAILKREAEGDANDYEVTLEELAAVLKGYVLPKWNSADTNQFTLKMLKEVMTAYTKIIPERIKIKSSNPITYKIKYGKLPEKNTNDYFLQKYFYTLTDNEKRQYQSAEMPDPLNT
jgi:hypothetical protein